MGYEDELRFLYIGLHAALKQSPGRLFNAARESARSAPSIVEQPSSRRGMSGYETALSRRPRLNGLAPPTGAA